MKPTVFPWLPMAIGVLFYVLTLPSEVIGKSNKSEGTDVQGSTLGDGGTKENERVYENINYLRSNEDYPTVKLASFNLQKFGKKKSENEQVLKIIAKVIMRYDLIALQEITDVKEKAIKKLIGSVNQESEHPYHYVISPRVGRTNQKEQYGLMFRPEVFQVTRHIVYDDSDGDPFSREPQLAEVLLKINGEKFGIINVHVAPLNASSEINSLTNVHAWVQSKWRLKNVIILGDLNADCNYIRKKDIPSIGLLNNPNKYRWLVPDTFDTTVGNSNCAYDRIIVSGPYLAKNVVKGSTAVFEFDKAYQLDEKFALNVSDHYPVEVSLFVDSTIDSVPGQVQSSGRTWMFQKDIQFYELCMTLFSVIFLL